MMQSIPFSTSAFLVLLVVVGFITCSATPFHIQEESSNSIFPESGGNHVQRILQAAALDRFQIGDSRITFGGTVIQLIYPLNDLVSDGSVSTQTFLADCETNITGNDFLVPTIIYDDNPAPDGTKNRQVTVRYDVDPTAIQETEVWVQDQKKQFFMNFCMSLSLHEGDAETTMEKASLETVVRLQVDLVGDFGVEVDVLPNDPGSENVFQNYFVEGFLCDDNLEEIVYLYPLVQGEKVKVCVKPTDDALADGVYMRRVDSFTYWRDNPTAGATVTQIALTDGESANPALTELFCERGWELCHFDTLLKSDFYFGPGRVFGYGEAWLQFGSGSSRKLKFAITGRNRHARSLQDVEGGFAGSALFNVEFFVAPGEEFKFGAVAYECDSQNKKIPDPSPKTLGASVKICITPDEISNEFGMTINRLDSWNWTSPEGASQISAEVGGGQAEDGFTILVCVDGATMCIFRTQFTEDFYTSDGEAVGVGNVVLQYALLEEDDLWSLALSRRRNLESSHSTSRHLQVGGQRSPIAGMVEVGVNTPVQKKSKNELSEKCQYEQKVSEWWVEEPINDRYMYIGVLVGILAAIACSLLWCWCCPCLSERRDDEEIIEKDSEGNIKVNVDFKSSKDENVLSNTTKKSSSSKSLLLGCDETDSTAGSGRHRKSSSRSGLSISDGSADLEPEKYDVIFGDESHPGTKKLVKAIRQFRKSSPDESYGPHAYRLIKKEVGDIRYFRTNKKGRPVEASKKKAVALIGDIFEDMEQGTKIKKSKSAGDLESYKDGSREDRRSSRRITEETTSMKRSSSNKSLR